MSLPPPSDPYGPPPQGGGQPGGGVPSWGGQQPGFGGQYGQPPQGQPGGPGGPPPWGQQPQWSRPPGPPPGRGGRGKWILGGLAVVLAIALAVVITVLVVRPSGSGPTPTPTNGHSDFASAGDDGPVNIITEDPTCEAWAKISLEYADKAKTVNWEGHDATVPASAWTSEQRTMYETVGDAMTRAADQTGNLLKLTPHRVMRELYGQFIAYTRTFVERIPSYVATDDNVAVTSDAAGNGLVSVCAAIDFRAAQAVAPLVSQPTGPSSISSPEDPSMPVRFLPTPNRMCPEFDALVTKFSDDTEAWRAIDPNIPSTEWTPDQRSTYVGVASVMSTNADEMERLGRQSGNPTLEDVAVLAAQYRRAFVTAIPSYSSADNYLAAAAASFVRLVNWGCKAAA